MMYLQTSMILTDDKSEGIPENLEIPSVIIRGNSKEEILRKLAFHLELSHAIMQRDGVDGVNYQAIAKQKVKRWLIKQRKY